VEVEMVEHQITCRLLVEHNAELQQLELQIWVLVEVEEQQLQAVHAKELMVDQV
tara:strand:- start:53 stop:214 length:162 start_codon:yes stop_codon:yes gene_type:complete